MKKKILIVTSEFPPQPGGIGNHAYHLGVYLSKNKYTVSVIADQREINNTEEKSFDKALPFAVKRIPLRNRRWFMYFDRIKQTLQCFKGADYIIATGKFSLWNVAFCSLFYKRSTLAVIHGSEVNLKAIGLRKAIDWSLMRFDTVIAVSNYTKNLVSHINRDIAVIPNGIDVEKWVSTVIESKALKGNPVLTTVGRVSARKGQLQVIKLLPDLLNDYPEIHYHCIGIPTEAETFKTVAQALGVATHITFHGAVNDTYLKEVLKETDVFVMLSTESQTGDVEGFGIAILEANALGIPAIGSKGCGIEDAIEEELTGFLIDGQDGHAFKSALTTILNDKIVFRKQAEKWAQSYDWKVIIKQYIELIP